MHWGGNIRGVAWDLAGTMIEQTSLLKIVTFCAHLTLYRRVTSEVGRMGLHECFQILGLISDIKVSVSCVVGEHSSSITFQLPDSHSITQSYNTRSTA
jgi:hypothetical protein